MADVTTEQLAVLSAELAALREQVSSLDRELQRANGHLDMTMRGQLRCRACGCRRIAHAMEILDRGDDDVRKAMALYQPSWWSEKTQGHLEAYVCTGCGLVEWWVKDPGSLEEHREYMRILDGATPGAGPFR